MNTDKKVKKTVKKIQTVEVKDLTPQEEYIEQNLEMLQNIDYSTDEYNSAVKELAKIRDGEELPWKVQRFCNEYTIHYNEQKAALMAGWPEWNALAFGKRLLAHPLVRKEIERLQKIITKKLQITRERVLSEYASIAYANILDYYDEEGKLLPVKKLPRELGAAIQEVQMDRFGNFKGYKLMGKTVALDALSKSLGLFDKDSEKSLPVNLKEFLNMLPPDVQESIKVGMAKRVGMSKK